MLCIEVTPNLHLHVTEMTPTVCVLKIERELGGNVQCKDNSTNIVTEGDPQAYYSLHKMRMESRSAPSEISGSFAINFNGKRFES